MTEIIPAPQSNALSLPEQWRFAETVAGSSILPRAYREDPGAVLVAVNLGSAMGLTPAESLYRIHVIEGKPSASAELITSNVRRAGHRLRIKGDAQSATVQIVRADDPDWTYEVTWTMADAQRAGLTGKSVWKAYPAAMLRARAITECARQACPEALYGVTYTEEEARESAAQELTAPARRESASDLLSQTPQGAAPSGTATGVGAPDAVEVEGNGAATSDAPPPADPTPAADRPVLGGAPDGATTRQVTAINVALKARGIGTKGTVDQMRIEKLAWLSEATGREITSSKDLTKDEAGNLLDHFAAEDKAMPNALPTTSEEGQA